MQDMNDILKLVRSGNLKAATAAIQGRLNPSGQASDDAGDGLGPMKDITPSTPLIEDRAKPAKARPKSTGRTDDIRGRTKARQTDTANARWLRRSGSVPYRVYVPAVPVADAPLIVMLHGCTQNPEDFAAGTGMNAVADSIGAHVIWPEQVRSANPNGCWNWFEPAHQGRTGEAAAIAAIAKAVAVEFAPQSSGIHVAGLSAGGAMAAILGTHYPEVFTSVAVHSGLPAGSARDVATAFGAMRSGGAGKTALPVPGIVFHGKADGTVSHKNGAAVFKGAAAGLKPRRRTTQMGGRAVTVTRSEHPDGTPAAEFWEIDALGHAWSGGKAAGSFADPAGPDASAEMIRFFQEVDRGRKS